jgi:hypothetical protein
MEVGLLSKGDFNFDELLSEYRMIWNNRLLASRDRSSEETLTEAVERELLDENSHPRIRKNKFEKYFSAINRITQSTISNEAKVSLIQLHNRVMEDLIKGSNHEKNTIS